MSLSKILDLPEELLLTELGACDKVIAIYGFPYLYNCKQL